jgi:hypothetical protein
MKYGAANRTSPELTGLWNGQYASPAMIAWASILSVRP